MDHPRRPRLLAFLAAGALVVAILAQAVPAAAVATIVPNVTPNNPDGLNGWYTVNVDVSFNVTIPGGETEILPRDPDCNGVTTISTDTTGTTITCTVDTDAGTNSADSGLIRRDATPPAMNVSISPFPVVLGSTATGSTGATDATSGVDAATETCTKVKTKTIGPHHIRCFASDNAGNASSQRLNFTVKKHGGAATIVAKGGAHQTTFTTTKFKKPLTARVVDPFGNPVPGVKVKYQVPGGGASAILAKKSDTTDAHGFASVKAKANGRTGSYQVTATTKGVGTSAKFDLTNVLKPYFIDDFSHGLSKWNIRGKVSIARRAGKPAPSALVKARHSKSWAIHKMNAGHKTACASAQIRLNSLGNEAVALLRLRSKNDDGVGRVSVESDRELFVRNDFTGGVNLSGTKIPIGKWNMIEVCATVGGSGSLSLYLNGSKILGWNQNLGPRSIRVVNMIENDTKTFSANFDNVRVDGKPGS